MKTKYDFEKYDDPVLAGEVAAVRNSEIQSELNALLNNHVPRRPRNPGDAQRVKALLEEQRERSEAALAHFAKINEVFYQNWQANYARYREEEEKQDKKILEAFKDVRALVFARAELAARRKKVQKLYSQWLRKKDDPVSQEKAKGWRNMQVSVLGRRLSPEVQEDVLRLAPELWNLYSSLVK